jgi:hypothetical protein
VHIKTLEAGNGEQYGVGMPVIAFFSRKITSAKALQDATKVTVNGRQISGGWYFEYSSYYKSSYPIEGHLRPEHYWPAHSKVHVDIRAQGPPAGKGLTFNDSLALDFFIGAKNIGVVDDTRPSPQNLMSRCSSSVRPPCRVQAPALGVLRESADVGRGGWPGCAERGR